MSKLLKFKDWLTLSDAARHLSILFGEEVREHDVLRLGLDGHLRLSVDLVNHAKARRGRISRYSEQALDEAITSGNFPADLDWVNFPAEMMSRIEGINPGQTTLLLSLHLDEDRYLSFDDDSQVQTIDGIWDLPMVGGERIDVEYAYQQLTSGPEVKLSNLDGAFVQLSEDEVWQLQESFDDNEFQRGSRANLDSLKSHIRAKNLSAEEADRLLAVYKSNRKKFLADRLANPKNSGYYPASGLPRDAVLVVRTSELLDLQRKSEDRTEEKSMGTKEKNVLLRIIAALAKEAKIDLDNPSKAGALIENLSDQNGAHVSKRAAEDHVKSVLNELGRRTK